MYSYLLWWYFLHQISSLRGVPQYILEPLKGTFHQSCGSGSALMVGSDPSLVIKRIFEQKMVTLKIQIFSRILGVLTSESESANIHTRICKLLLYTWTLYKRIGELGEINYNKAEKLIMCNIFSHGRENFRFQPKIQAKFMLTFAFFFARFNLFSRKCAYFPYFILSIVC